VTFFGQLVGKSLEAQLLIALWNTFLTTGGLWLLGVSVGLFLGLGRSLFRLLGVSVRLCGASRADASREGRADAPRYIPRVAVRLCADLRHDFVSRCVAVVRRCMIFSNGA
jgi:hypothetical protein